MSKKTITPISYKWVQGGNVPGGHRVIFNAKKKSKPFVTPMRECNSIALRHSDVIVDIGAYIGTYAIRCARFPVKKVVAYEPTPRTYQILSLTKLPNLQTIQAAVVGDNNDTVDLYISSGIGVTNSIALSNRKAHVLTVPAINYIDAISEATIVKIDVEGAEYGFPIIQPWLRAVIIDFHPVPGDWINKARHIIGQLLESGFETIIEPDFSSGWTSAGSWLRPKETSGEHGPLMNGDLCCGCGRGINALGKALCRHCFNKWTKKHRASYALARE